MPKRLINSIVLFCLCGLILGCSSNDKPIKSNTVGVMKLSVDGTLYPLVYQAVALYKSSYPKAVINSEYVPGQKAFVDLMKDSAMTIITTEKLTKSQERQFKQAYEYVPSYSQIGYDAVALIVNKSNKDSNLTEQEVKAIFKGTIGKWAQLGKGDSTQNGTINLVFDNKYSSTINAITNFIGQKELNTSNISVADSTKGVIQFVNEHTNALGIIGYNWISEKDNQSVKKILTKIAVVAIAPSQQKSDSLQYYQPTQETIIDNLYPLIRNIYIINRGQSVSLGTGFASFLNSPRGQLLIKMSGLVPMRITPMVINMKGKF